MEAAVGRERLSSCAGRGGSCLSHRGRLASRPAVLVVCGAAVNGVSLEAAAERRVVVHRQASCAHISPYWTSVAAIAALFCPMMLVATSDANWLRLARSPAAARGRQTPSRRRLPRR